MTKFPGAVQINMKVIIVGAGYSGLSAAIVCRKQGYDAVFGTKAKVDESDSSQADLSSLKIESGLVQKSQGF